MIDFTRYSRASGSHPRRTLARLRRLSRREDGQALVEMALVLPILLLLVLGIVDFGRAINYWNDENQIAELAARYLAVGTQPTWSNFPTKGSCNQPSDLTTLVTYEACLDSPELLTGSSSVQTPTVKVCYPSNQSGQPVKVTVSATYTWLPFGKFVNKTFPANSTLNGTATMRLENAISGTWVPATQC
jgi:Flp pilus assembly protein TadG